MLIHGRTHIFGRENADKGRENKAKKWRSITFFLLFSYNEPRWNLIALLGNETGLELFLPRFCECSVKSISQSVSNPKFLLDWKFVICCKMNLKTQLSLLFIKDSRLKKKWTKNFQLANFYTRLTEKLLEKLKLCQVPLKVVTETNEIHGKSNNVPREQRTSRGFKISWRVEWLNATKKRVVLNVSRAGNLWTCTKFSLAFRMWEREHLILTCEE